MRVFHVDKDGRPDQSLSKVLSMVLVMQAVISAIVIGGLLVFGFIVALR